MMNDEKGLAENRAQLIELGAHPRRNRNLIEITARKMLESDASAMRAKTRESNRLATEKICGSGYSPSITSCYARKVRISLPRFSAL